MKMTLTIAVLVIVRAAVQVLIGYLMARGITLSSTADEITGAIMFILTVAWSLYEKHKLLGAVNQNTSNEKTN